MKIVHICLAGPVTDGWNYQDNLITKYHKCLGNDVTMITSKWIWNTEGKLIKYEESNYLNKDGVKVIRLEIRGKDSFDKKFKLFRNLKETLYYERPDILFIHNLSFLDIITIMGYLKKNKHVKVFVDNHADLSNSAKNWISKYFLHKVIWRKMAKLIEPFTLKFYGVLPARVDFLKEIYKLPDEKCELLVMGGDDELIKEASISEGREKVRRKYGIQENDFLIVTGGKIDNFKKQTFLLIEVLRRIPDKKVKLIIFGSIIPELKQKFLKLCDNEKIQFVGWIHSKQTYDFFAAADLVVFPGRHSVFWEQVVAQGVPMVCRHWEGTTHINLGGNVEFIKEDSIDEIKNILTKIIIDENKYNNMLKVAAGDGKKSFSYKEIAKRSIEMV